MLWRAILMAMALPVAGVAATYDGPMARGLADPLAGAGCAAGPCATEPGGSGAARPAMPPAIPPAASGVDHGRALAGLLMAAAYDTRALLRLALPEVTLSQRGHLRAGGGGGGVDPLALAAMPFVASGALLALRLISTSRAAQLARARRRWRRMRRPQRARRNSKPFWAPPEVRPSHLPVAARTEDPTPEAPPPPAADGHRAPRTEPRRRRRRFRHTRAARTLTPGRGMTLGA